MIDHEIIVAERLIEIPRKYFDFAVRHYLGTMYPKKRSKEHMLGNEIYFEEIKLGKGANRRAWKCMAVESMHILEDDPNYLLMRLTYWDTLAVGRN